MSTVSGPRVFVLLARAADAVPEGLGQTVNALKQVVSALADSVANFVLPAS